MRRHFLIVVVVFVSMGFLFSAFVRMAHADEYPVMCGDLVLNGRNLGIREIVGYATENGKAFHLIKVVDAPDSQAVRTPIDLNGNMPFLKNVRPCPSGKTRLGPDQPKPGAVAQLQATVVPSAPQQVSVEIKPTEPTPLTVLALEKEASENTGLKTGTIVLVLLVLAGVALIGGIIRWQGRKPTVEA
jgi:hypothetical protein